MAGCWRLCSCDVLISATILFRMYVLSVGSSTDDEQIKVSEFDVKPGGQVHVQEDSWDGFTCKFTYAAQGGTKEKWTFVITRSNKQEHYSCSIERPGGNSYLFFLHFKLELPGSAVYDGEAYGKNEKLLLPEEYKLDKKNNMVSSIDDGFKAELSRVTLYARTGKSEL